MARRKCYRRADDPYPGGGFRLELEGKVTYLTRAELKGAAQIGQAYRILGASQEEIEQAIIAWLVERRQSRRWFHRRV